MLYNLLCSSLQRKGVQSVCITAKDLHRLSDALTTEKTVVYIQKLQRTLHASSAETTRE